MNTSLLPPPALETIALHADHLNSDDGGAESVAPTLSFSTTFRQPHPDSELAKRAHDMSENPDKPSAHVYSRYTQDTRQRTESVISAVIGAHSLLYASGLSAAYAAIQLYCPSAVAIRGGYFGVHEGLRVYCKNRDVKIVDLDDDYPVSEGARDKDCPELVTGTTLVWVETPLNPTGEARDLAHYVKRAHDAKGVVVVDSTFAPPPLQDPFQFNVDLVMHSGTKYFGGHSDLLMGILSTRSYSIYKHLWLERAVTGTVPGSMETYLLLRSLRTMALRVRQQSATATRLAKFLYSLTAGKSSDFMAPPEIANGKFILHVWHSSLQPRERSEFDTMENTNFDPSKQMTGGHSPTFGVMVSDELIARYLPHNLSYFVVR